MPSRRRFLRDCSVVATAASLTPAAVLAQGRGGSMPAAGRALFEHFAAQLNTAFRLAGGQPGPALTLVDAQRLKPAPPAAEDARNERFSLLFRGPVDQPLAQDTYVFEHRRLGRREIFIVPTVSLADPAHCYYEAVFNFPLHPVDVAAQLSRAPQRAARR